MARGLVQGWPLLTLFGSKPQNRTPLVGATHERKRSDTDRDCEYAIRRNEWPVFSRRTLGCIPNQRVRPVPDCRTVISCSNGQVAGIGEWGSQPRWRADGTELYFIAPDGKMMA